MPTEVHWHLGRGGADPVRGRVEITDFVVGIDDIDAEVIRRLLEIALRSAHRLEEVAHEVYGSVRGLHPYTTRSARAVFGGISISDPRFFFHEWDTRLHWPPFGKHSELAAWVREHGMEPEAAFFIARKMAPIAPTNARVGPYTATNKAGGEYQRSHIMTVGGLGGTESDQRPPRMVATRGKYALTDAVDREAQIVADEAMLAIGALIEDILPEGTL